MARIPSVAELTRLLNEAKARETALEARQALPPKVGTGQRRPTDSVKYSTIFSAEDLIINAPSNGIAFFGGLAALGLAAPDASPRAPRGFRPAKVMATRGKATPSTETSALSGRRYLKYSIEATGDTQSSFSAPVSAETVAALKTKVETLINSKKDDVGEYGRIWFEPERPVFSASGSVGVTAP